jgi:hypothetical protein
MLCQNGKLLPFLVSLLALAFFRIDILCLRRGVRRNRLYERTGKFSGQVRL